MSVKIKLSYTDEEEYQEIMRLLSPVVKSWKMQPAKGKYKRAYSILNRERTTGEPRANHEKGVKICEWIKSDTKHGTNPGRTPGNGEKGRYSVREGEEKKKGFAENVKSCDRFCE